MDHSHNVTEELALKWGDFKYELVTHLDSIEASGEIASHKNHAVFVNPVLEIDEKHSISLPLRPDDAGLIRDACRQAPFGRGDETVVDTSVRKTWELDHTQFRLCNPAWDDFLENTLLKGAAQDLGLHGARAEPYKLLLYEPGSFFKPHRDSEKTPGMVATLVVCLPSEHEGGEVHLSFGDRQRTFATGPHSKYNMTALAWYSDVTHEVKELKSGYRLVLTYNVVASNPGTASLSHHVAQSDRLSQLLKQFQRHHSSEEKVCYTLAHQYSESSLSLSVLKGRDACVLRALKRVVDDAGFRLFVGHMSCTMEEPEYMEEWDEGESNMLSLTNIFTLDGTKIATSGDLEMKELLVEDQFDHLEPVSREAGQYTGNASVPDTCLYENTVVIITPKDRVMSMFGKFNVDAKMTLALLDLKEHPDHAPYIDNVVKVMTDAVVRQDPMDISTVAKVIDLGVQLGRDDLIQMAARNRPRDSEVIQALARSFLRKTQHSRAWTEAEKVAFTDWEPWFGSIARSAVSLMDQDQQVTIFSRALGDAHLTKSLEKWAKTVTHKRLEDKFCWEGADLQYVQAVLVDMHEDTDWMTTWLFPKLVQRGTRDLLLPLILWAMQPQAFDTKPLISHVAEKSPLHLAILPEESRISTAAPLPYYSSRRRWNLSYHQVDNDLISSPTPSQVAFVNLIDRSLRAGYLSILAPVIQESARRLSVMEVRSGDSAKLLAFLSLVHSKLKDHDDAHIPAVASLYRTILTMIIKATPIPRYPVDRGWVMPPKGCGRCEHCHSLDSFLQSPFIVWTLQKPGHIRKHIESQLGPSLLWTLHNERTSPALTLVVTKRKMTYADDVMRYNEAISTFNTLMAPFNTKWVEDLLSDGGPITMVMPAHSQQAVNNSNAAPAAANPPPPGPSGSSGFRPYLGPASVNVNSQPTPGVPGATAGQKRPSGDAQEQYDGREKRLAIVIDD